MLAPGARPPVRTTTMLTAVVAVLLSLVAGALPAQAAAPTLSFVGAAATSGNRTAHTVTIPAGVRAGDTLVAFLTTNAVSSTVTDPAGWRLVGTRDGSGSRARAWTRQVATGDAGSTLTVRTSATAKSSLVVSAYRSSGTAASVTAAGTAGSNTSATSHTAPAAAVADAGSWAVRAWSGKGSTDPTWTTPGTRRAATASTGSGLTSAVVSDAPVTGTTTGTSVAQSSAALGNTHQFTVVVSPGTAPSNQPPVPAFTQSCQGLSCSFDARSSTDADGDALTYRWSFGDGTTGTGATATRTYTSGGAKTVTLTVSDGTVESSSSRTVSLRSSLPTPGHTAIAPEKPRLDLPKITNGDVADIEVVGNRVFVGGTFTSIANNTSGSTTSYNQARLAAYDLNTGLVDTTFRPVINNEVTSVEASPDGKRLYVGGRFSSINGVTRNGLAQIDLTTGAPVAGFVANADARVNAVAVSDDTVYLGGRFTRVNGTARGSLAAVDATTGAVDPGFVNNLSIGIGIEGAIGVQDLALSHDLTRLLVVHTARQIAGLPRSGVGIIDTTTKSLTPWRSTLWDDNLQFVGGIQRIISGDISPDDSYFVVTSAFGGDRPPLNDTIIAFPMSGGDDVQPRWITRAFDSVLSVAISEKAVYIGGHMSWVESPSAPDPWPGRDDVGYGTGQGLSGYGLGDAVVNRSHLAALDPADGKGLEWNPYSNSRVGNAAMELTPRGLITGGDATTQGGYNVGRVAFFDFQDRPAANGVETTIDSPISGRVLPAGREFAIEGTAAATSGVRGVALEVQDSVSRRYLQDDLTTWSTSWNSINADLDAAGRPTSAWRLRLTVPGNVNMQVFARTTGTDGRTTPVKAQKRFETFGLDDTTPTASIGSPAAGLLTSKTFRLSGTASDDKGVLSLSLVMRDAAGRYLQEDGTSGTTYHTFRITPDVVGATSTSWSYEVTVPTEGEWLAEVTPRDTAGQSALDSTQRTFNVFENGQTPTISLSAPAVMVPPTAAAPVTVRPGQPITFAGSANDDGRLYAIDIHLQNNSTGESIGNDGSFGPDKGANFYRIRTGINASSTNWSWTTPFDLGPGSYTFRARALDTNELSTPTAQLVNYTFNVQVADDAPPKATLAKTGTQPVSGSVDLVLDGTATDDKGVNDVRVAIRDRDTARYLTSAGTTSASYTTLGAQLASPGATSTSWTLPVRLPSRGDWAVTAFAVDTVGQRDFSSANATARYPVYPGDTAPVLTETLLTPAEGAVFDSGRIYVSGRAEDNESMQRVEVAVVNAQGRFLSSAGTFQTGETWRTAFLTSPGTPGSNFAYTTPVLPEGAYSVRVRGVDQNDLVTAVPSVRNVRVTIPANNKPVAVIAAPQCTDNVCTFDARGSTDENPATLTYSWNFGNGTGTGPLPSRTFTQARSYTVTLTARDEWGISSDPVSVQVTIAEPPGNVAPTPTLNPPSCSGLTCNFSAVGTTDPNTGDTLTYAWDFGDPGSGAANSSTSSAVAHAFTQPGTYLVTLTARDGWGKGATVTRQVTVTSP